MKRKWIFRTSKIIVILLVIWGGVEVNAVLAIKRMERLIATVRSLPLGVKGISNYPLLMHGYDTQSLTDGKEQIYSVATLQGGLVQLGRYLQIVAVLRFDSSGKLQDKRVFMSGETSRCCFVGVWQALNRWPNQELDFEMSQQSPYQVSINLTEAAIPQQKEKAWDLHVNCIAALRGCISTEQILNTNDLK